MTPHIASSTIAKEAFEQNYFHFELHRRSKKLPRVLFRTFDQPIAKLAGKAQTGVRPDMLYVLFRVDGARRVLHLEYDEDTSHERSLERLECVRNQLEIAAQDHFVVRICGQGTNPHKALFARVRTLTGQRYALTPHGDRFMFDFAVRIDRYVTQIEEGTVAAPITPLLENYD